MTEARLWTDAEYAITDSVYAQAIVERAKGATVIRGVLVHKAQKATGRPFSSVNSHFGNLTAARASLGLPTLPEVAPFAHFPPKLTGFLRTRYGLEWSAGLTFSRIPITTAP